MSEPVLRYATPADIEKFFGSLPKEGMRAIVADLNGETIGIAGIACKGGVLMMFSDLKPEMYRFRKSILKAGKMLTGMAHGLPVHAAADRDVVGSERFLEAIGFEHAYSTPAGEVYEWGH